MSWRTHQPSSTTCWLLGCKGRIMSAGGEVTRGGLWWKDSDTHQLPRMRQQTKFRVRSASELGFDLITHLTVTSKYIVLALSNCITEIVMWLEWNFSKAIHNTWFHESVCITITCTEFSCIHSDLILNQDIHLILLKVPCTFLIVSVIEIHILLRASFVGKCTVYANF